MALVGTIENFSISHDNWSEYVERVEQYFIANGINDADKKKGTLLTVIGSEAYRLLRNLVAPAKPAEKTFAEIVEVLKKHLNPLTA